MERVVVKRSEISLVALRRILRATERHGKALARASGLTPVQMRVLSILETDGRSTPKAIAAKLRVAQATMTALIDRLAAKGMVERQRSDYDRRQMNLFITEKGRAALESAPDPLQDTFVTEFEELPDWEQAMIVAALERVASMMNADEIDASPVLDLGDIKRAPPQ
ncbi:MarR family transcriptional regulator [Rhodobacteraceae bacterium WD3A24]|nr:MarR family transcriptional regulator [Rhodobacteraceae bacterium WD3A24]